MRAAVFYLFYAINYVITLLPLRILYFFSDIHYLIIYYLIGYRRKIVASNLKNSFPGKSPAELRKIERRFYRHLSDLVIETLKITQMRPAEMKRRFTIKDSTLLDRLYDEGRDVVAFFGHYNNWEWLSSIPLLTRYKGMSIYKPLKDKYFDRFLLNLRTKYGVNASQMENVFRDIIRFRNQNIRTAGAYLADQVPPRDNNPFWTTFLNQDTCFYRGPEKIAVKLNMAVLFAHISKVRRGYYELEFQLITEHPREEEPDFITSEYARLLEKEIIEKPEYWLWSHRRWKYKRQI